MESVICARCLYHIDAPTFYRSESGINICPSCEKALKDEGTKLPTTTANQIARTCNEIQAMLIEKNKAYGDSALNPVRVFSKVDNVEQIRVRIDDKLSRLARGAEQNEDVILDLIGYLILLRIATKNVQQ